jgi:hypothetical protein
MPNRETLGIHWTIFIGGDMRIVKISNQKRNFRVFQVCADTVQPEFSIYKNANTNKSIVWSDLNQEDIKNLTQSAYDVLQNSKLVHAEVLFELLNGIGAPGYLQDAVSSGSALNEQDKQSKAQQWLGKLNGLTPNQSANDTSSIQKSNAKLLEKELVRIQIARLPITNENEIILNLVENTLSLTKDMISSLTQLGLSTLDAILSSSVSSSRPSVVDTNVNMIQQQIIAKSNIAQKNTFFDIKVLVGWFIDKAKLDNNYNQSFFEDVGKAAKAYAQNRLSAVQDKDIAKSMIATVVPAFIEVLKITHEEGMVNQLPQDVVRSKLLAPIKALDAVWPHWKADIGRIHLPGKGPLNMLKTLYGKESEQSGWLSQGQYMEIKLKFNEKLTYLIMQATQSICAAQKNSCFGFTKLVQNLNTPGFLANTGEVAKCFQSANSSDPMFSAGSIASATEVVKACTSFHPDVKITDGFMLEIVDNLLAKAVQWGEYKRNKNQKIKRDVGKFVKDTRSLMFGKGKDIPPNQFTFDIQQPNSPVAPQSQPAKTDQQNPTSGQSMVSTQIPEQDQAHATATEQVQADQAPADQPKQQQIEKGWDNPETILFASQILLALTQFSFKG